MRAMGQWALAGWLGCVLPSHAQVEPAVADQSEKLFVSADQPLRSGTWRYRVVRGGETFTCSAMDAPSVSFSLVIENDSDETLDCSVSLVTTRRENHENTAVVEPRGRQLLSSVCTSGEGFERAAADCAIRQPPLLWKVPDGCSYSVVRAQPLDYPPSSRRNAEQAPVYIVFSLPEREGHPKKVGIASSSGFPRLDEAARRHVERMVVRTSCPGVDYQMRLSFRLNEYGAPVASRPTQP